MQTDMKLVLPPDFQGKELIVGTPQDFDRVRSSLLDETKRARTFTSIDDLAAYLQRWGTQGNTAVYCNKDSIIAILDETNSLQTAKFAVRWSTAFDQWKQALAQTFNQAAFKEFIERRQVDIVDGISLLNVVENLKLTTTIEHSGQYDNDHNYSVIFKESTGGESAVKIPKHFTVLIPLSDGDQAYSLQVELKLRKPKNADEKFTFSLKCWELEDVLRDAMNNRIEQLKDLLDGWQIYAGSPN